MEDIEIPTEQGPGKTKEGEKHWLDYATFIVGLLGLLGLAIYAGLTWGIFRENRQAVVEIERQTRIDERPWVKFSAPSAFELKNGKPVAIVAGQPLRVPIEFRNYGKTAALKDKTGISIEIAPIGKGPEMPGKNQFISMDPTTPPGQQIVAIYPAQTIGTGVIEPGDSISLTVSRQKITDGNIVDDPVSQSDVAKLIAGQEYILVWGEFWYSDIFGVQHETTFCQAIPREATLPKCANYNDVDSNDGTDSTGK